MTFEKGLTEVGDGVFAYLQPDGSWGWSNAGLVAGDGASVLVDTLFDLRLTAEMLEAMKPHTSRSPIATLVNTHANGDHCYGNQLVSGKGVDIVASAAAAKEMEEVSPQTLATMLSSDLGAEVNAFVRRAFGPFRFDDIEVTPPTTTFSGSLALSVGGRTVELLELGPAHTAGDLIAWLPEERVLFAGDLLFIGGTPIMWAGPIEGWIAACERMAALDPAVVIPGHGPITDVGGVRSVGDYLRTVADGTRARFEAGMPWEEAAHDLDHEIDGSPFAGWGDRERIVVTVANVYRALDPTLSPPTDLFARMATYRRAS